MIVSIITEQRLNVFSLNVQDRSVMTQETIWNIWGMIGLTPGIQDSLSYFLGLGLLPISRNDGWMDIYEILRIWTQGATHYIVSHQNRLFHTLKTRCGGGLRSLSASCHFCNHNNHIALGQNDTYMYFTDKIFKRMFLSEKLLVRISLTFVAHRHK